MFFLFIIPCHCHPLSSPSPCLSTHQKGICHDFALDVSDGHVFGGYIERFVHGLALWSILQYDATTVPRNSEKKMQEEVVKKAQWVERGRDNYNMGVSKNRGIPKWMVYNGNLIKNG